MAKFKKGDRIRLRGTLDDWTKRGKNNPATGARPCAYSAETLSKR